jgi:Gram-negative bacterial TonB protein C-terminal
MLMSDPFNGLDLSNQRTCSRMPAKITVALPRIMRGLAMRHTSAAIVLFVIAPLAQLSAQKPPITPPRLISLPVPDCKAGTPCHRSHGRVRLIVDVLENGKPGDIRAELGDAVLVAAATAAAQQAEFVPGSYFGKPAAMDYVLNLHF